MVRRAGKQRPLNHGVVVVNGRLMSAPRRLTGIETALTLGGRLGRNLGLAKDSDCGVIDEAFRSQSCFRLHIEWLYSGVGDMGSKWFGCCRFWAAALCVGDNRASHRPPARSKGGFAIRRDAMWLQPSRGRESSTATAVTDSQILHPGESSSGTYRSSWPPGSSVCSTTSS